MATWAAHDRQPLGNSDAEQESAVASDATHAVTLVALVNAITDMMACSVYNSTAVYGRTARPESFFHLTLLPDGQAFGVSPLRRSTNHDLVLQASITQYSAFTAGYWGPAGSESGFADRADANCSRGTGTGTGTGTASQDSTGAQVQSAQSSPGAVVRCVVSGPLCYMRAVHDELTSGTHKGYEPLDDEGEIDRGWDPRTQLPGARSAEQEIRHCGPDDTSFPLVSEVDKEEERMREAFKASQNSNVSL